MALLMMTGGRWIIIVLVLLVSTTTSSSLGFGSSTAGAGRRITRFTAIPATFHCRQQQAAVVAASSSSYRSSPKLHNNINERANGRYDGEGVRTSSRCNYFAAMLLNNAETSRTVEENHQSSYLRTPTSSRRRGGSSSFGIIATTIRRDYYSIIKTTAAALRRSLLSIIRTRRTVATKLSSLKLRPILLSILVLLGGNIAPAHASSLFGSGSSSKSSQHATTTTTTKIYTPLSSSSATVTNKIVKTIVTAGAVVAGVRTAGKVRTTMDTDDEDTKRSRGNSSSSSGMTSNIGRALELDDEEDGDYDDSVDVNAMNRHIANILAPTVVGEDMASQPSSSSSSSSSSSNDPLSIAWIERELKEADEMRKKVIEEDNERMRKLSSSSSSTSTTANIKGDASQLVKNLDAKIELLSRSNSSSTREVAMLPDVAQQQRGSVEEETIVTATAKEIGTARKEEDARRAKEWADAAASAAAVATNSSDKEEMARKENARKEKDLVVSEAIQLAASLADEKDEIRVEIGIARQRQKQLDVAAAAAAAAHTNNNNERRSKSHDDSMLTLSDSIVKARQQPKSTEEERILQQKYASIQDLEERAFNILVDLGMVDLNPDPETLDNIEEDE